MAETGRDNDPRYQEMQSKLSDTGEIYIPGPPDTAGKVEELFKDADKSTQERIVELVEAPGTTLPGVELAGRITHLFLESYDLGELEDTFDSVMAENEKRRKTNQFPLRTQIETEDYKRFLDATRNELGKKQDRFSGLDS